MCVLKKGTKFRNKGTHLQVHPLSRKREGRRCWVTPCAVRRPTPAGWLAGGEEGESPRPPQKREDSVVGGWRGAGFTAALPLQVGRCGGGGEGLAAATTAPLSKQQGQMSGLVDRRVDSQEVCRWPGKAEGEPLLEQCLRWANG